MISSIYLIGSLRNPRIPELAETLRDSGFDVFDDWYAAGPEADDYWQRYESGRGRGYNAALKGYAAQHTLAFDRHHLERCDAAVLLMPAGKSGHIELGYVCGLGKPAYVLLDKVPDRYDVMYAFTKGVFEDVDHMIAAIKAHGKWDDPS